MSRSNTKLSSEKRKGRKGKEEERRRNGSKARGEERRKQGKGIKEERKKGTTFTKLGKIEVPALD